MFLNTMAFARFPTDFPDLSFLLNKIAHATPTPIVKAPIRKKKPVLLNEDRGPILS